MKPTLQIGDRMLVSRLIYKVRALKRGDVAVFIPPHDRDKIFVKRIVALEGDTIETKGNTLYVNGVGIDDSRYTQHTPNAPLYNRDFPPFAAPRYIPRGRAFADYSLPPHQFRMKFPAGKPFVVPKGLVFAMGDNRDGSIDSRVWGPVSVDDIKGQAIAIYWSSRDEDTARSRGIRAQLEDVRFNRIGRAIRSAFDG